MSSTFLPGSMANCSRRKFNSSGEGGGAASTQKSTLNPLKNVSYQLFMWSSPVGRKSKGSEGALDLPAPKAARGDELEFCGSQRQPCSVSECTPPSFVRTSSTAKIETAVARFCKRE